MAISKATIEKHLGDRWWRLNNLYYIINKDKKRVLFKPNYAQKFLYDNIWCMNIVLKSRQQGITTWWCIFALDACLFNSNYRAGITAHNKDDALDFFDDKVKYPYDNLPKSIKDLRPADSNTARKLSFSNNSSIRVGTSMRSGTLNFLHVSEYGKICAKYPEKAKEIRTGSFNTVQAGQIISVESTAEGAHGDFHDSCVEAQGMQGRGEPLTTLDFKFFFFPWHEDDSCVLDPTGVTIPDEMAQYFRELHAKGIKTSPEQQAWYVKKKKTQKELMKQEYPATPEEAFEAKVKGAYYAKEIEEARAKGRICDFPVEPNIPVKTWWDIGRSDDTVIWFTQEVGREVRIVDYYADNMEDYPYYARVLQEKGYFYSHHELPHDAGHTRIGMNNKSGQQQLRDLGVWPSKVQPKPSTAELIHDINRGREMLKKLVIHKTNCAEGLKALALYRSEYDDKREVFKDFPVHDWTSHTADAFRTLVVGFNRSGEHRVGNKQRAGFAKMRRSA